MAEYIERAAIIAALEDYYEPINPDFPMTLGLGQISEVLQNIPAADVAEVRHARWNNWGYEPLWQECSACNYRIQYSYSKDCKFCPNCGARMDKEEEREVSE